MSKVTIFVTAVPGPPPIYYPNVGISLRDTGLALANLVGGAIAPAVLGFNTLTLGAPVAFMGTDIWVMTNEYAGKSIPLDGVQNAGLGFHACGRDGGNVGPIDTMGVINGSGNPANMWIRITGPAGLPVELESFKVE